MQMNYAKATIRYTNPDIIMMYAFSGNVTAQADCFIRAMQCCTGFLYNFLHQYCN